MECICTESSEGEWLTKMNEMNERDEGVSSRVPKKDLIYLYKWYQAYLEASNERI